VGDVVKLYKKVKALEKAAKVTKKARHIRKLRAAKEAFNKSAGVLAVGNVALRPAISGAKAVAKDVANAIENGAPPPKEDQA
jgi:hypothetical protein